MPPINLVFKVIITDPTHIITKTVVNTIPEFFAEATDKIKPKNMHIKNGPHKSPNENIIKTLKITVTLLQFLDFVISQIRDNNHFHLKVDSIEISFLEIIKYLQGKPILIH